MRLFPTYESPSLFSRAVMAAGDAFSRVAVPCRPTAGLPLAQGAVDTLLLLRLDGIGDNVCSWPALALLRERLPHTHIALAVGPWVAPLYRECPWVDEVIAWDSGLFGLFRGKGLEGLPRDLRISRELRGRSFDAGIDLRGDLLSISLLRLVAPPVRIAHTARGGGRLLTDPLTAQGGHEAQRAYQVAGAALGLAAAPAPRVRDWTRPEATEAARVKLAACGWRDDTPSVALCPLALWRWRQWPKERFLELAARLKQELGLQVIWFLEQGCAHDFATGDPVFRGPLDQVAAALGLCRLAVSNDTGLLHLALAAGCRTVQLFGPGEAARFAHAGEGTVLLHDTSCRHYPCTQRGDCANLQDGCCLEKITVDKVLTAVCGLVEEAR